MGNTADASSSHGDDDIHWESSALGSFARWPESLRAYFLTICSLPHPAAIFWDDTQILLRNKPWTAGRTFIKGQGQPQREVLSEQLRKALESIIDTAIPQELRHGDLFEQLTFGHRNVGVAILSQMHPKGVLVQLVHRSPPRAADSSTGHATDKDVIQQKNLQDQKFDSEETAKQGDDVPIDEHPFFRRFAELLPSGLAILDREAKAMFVNRKFWDLTTLEDKDNDQFTSWPQSIHPDDYDRVIGAYRKAFSQQDPLRIEFRAKDHPQPWRLLLLTPLGDENTHQISTRDRGGFICSIVDISAEKSAELTERRAAQQARERKVQQEKFIDMISHEIRNPLSAVLHCAEDIAESIGGNGSPKDAINVDMIHEALATINLCVKHQKNIVDDVLSFSKLDASLLSLKPSLCRPSEKLKTTLKMFSHEFRKEKLQFQFLVEPAYDSLPVREVMADMPRVGQVLINLMTNAIKFTHRGNGEKRITCSVSARKTRPKSYPPDVVFFRNENLSKMDATNNEAWGNGEELFLMVAVKDSGIGISRANQARLFERFRQATPKTEEMYGGSGLGLNISRKICQLHGGEIGVSSKEGEGSTFGFFVRVRRPAEGSDNASIEHTDTDDAKLRDGLFVGIAQATPGSGHGMNSFDWQKPTPTREQGSYLDKSGEDTTSQKLREGNDDNKGPTRGTKDASVGEPESRSAPQSGSSDDAIAPRREHVLLVEDNQVNQKLLRRKLERKGYKVTTANNGQEAVAKFKDAPSLGGEAGFDIVLIDKEMPILDGNAATREIRDLEQRGEGTSRTPIIGVTANVRDEQQDEMLASGMDDIISKPYEINEMITKIAEVTRKNKLSNTESSQTTKSI